MSRAAKLLKRSPFLLIPVAALVGWLIWVALRGPVYSSHSHPHSESLHEHSHTHGGDLDHGHEHFGLSGTQTHSHPHRHPHQHASPVDSKVEGLTQIGHVHQPSGATSTFWAKAVAAEGKIHLEFFREDGESPAVYQPADSNLSAQLFHGSKLEAKLSVQWADGGFVGDLPDGFFCLPTHAVRFSNLKMAGEEFEAVIPIRKSLAKIPSDLSRESLPESE